MKKVLVIDNDKRIRDNLQMVLESNGYKVKSESDGIIALFEIEQFKPDLILTEIDLPNLDGFELFKIVEKRYGCLDFPFIFISTQGEKALQRKVMILGAQDFITKPINTKELLESVKTCLRKNENLTKYNLKLKENIIKYFPHELRTPLMPILNFSNYLSDEIDALEKDEIKEVAEQINYAGRRLLTRIEKFLIFIELETLDFNSDILNANTEFNYDFISKTIYGHPMLRIKQPLIKYSIRPASINIHSYFLTKLLYEAIENAVKFSERNKEIKITSKINGHYYLLEIHNYGMGMSKDEISLISEFRQFRRGIHNQEGNGLGLAIVQKIVDRFGGEMRLESEINNYLILKIHLPMQLNYTEKNYVQNNFKGHENYHS